MKDPIIQEVREARAEVAADFGFDLKNFFAWAKTHATAEQKAQHRLPTGTKKVLVAGGRKAKPVARQQQRARALAAPTTR